MNQPPSLKKIHIFAIAAGILLVGIFFWSTLSTLAFNGPTENPSAGNGAIYSDSSNNVYIGGNLNVSGTISGADLGGSTISAANVSAADFGSNTGGGQFTFPGWLSVGSDSPGGDYDSALLIQDTGNDPADGAVLAIDYNNDYLSNDNTGDLIIGGDGSNSIDIGTNGSADLAVASSGYVGIGTTNPLSTLDVYGGQLLVRDNDNGANVGDGVRIGYDGTSGFGSPSIGFRASDQSERFEISVPSSSMNTANERISISGDCSGGCPMTEYLSVNRTGNVGIGTTTPASPLTVVGNIYATGNITCGGTCGGGGSSQWTTTSTGVFYNSGDVGIGTASPGAPLDVEAPNSGSYNTQLIVGQGVGNQYDIGRISASGYLSIQGTQTGYNDILLAPSSGNVGIGTASPGAVLDIKPSTGAVAGAGLRLENGAAGDSWELKAGSPGVNNSYFTIQDITASSTPLTIENNGYVGIGTTSPGYPLTVAGGADITGNLTVGSGSGIINTNVITSQYYQDPTQIAAYLQFANGGGTSYFNERGDTSTVGFFMLGAAGQTGAILQIASSSNAVYLDVSASGNVGIGTSTPSQSLTVGNNNQFTVSSAGNVTSTGNITAASLDLTGGAQTASTITAPTTIGKCASTTVTISGATSSTGAVFVSPLTYPGNGYNWQGYVSALNTVVVEECAATTTTGSAVKFNAIYIQ